MLKQFYTPMRWTAIIFLILVVMVNVLWAVNNVKTQRIRLGDPIKQMNIARDANGSSITATIRAQSVDNYLREKGLKEAIITVKTVEEWVTNPDGSSHRRLTFTFGPSGCYFTTPFELELKQDYVTDDCWLFDEKGESIPATRRGNGSILTFYIPHFSYYTYDQYY